VSYRKIEVRVRWMTRRVGHEGHEFSSRDMWYKETPTSTPSELSASPSERSQRHQTIY
jgi:hypothetical protein